VKATPGSHSAPGFKRGFRLDFEGKESDPLRRKHDEHRLTSGRLPCGVVAAALILATSLPAYAQPAEGSQAESDELPRIVISDPTVDLFRLALPDAAGERNLARSATEIEQRDLTITGLFRVLDPVSFPARPTKGRHGVLLWLWTEVGAQAWPRWHHPSRKWPECWEGRRCIRWAAANRPCSAKPTTGRAAHARTLMRPTTSSPSSPASAGRAAWFGARMPWAWPAEKGERSLRSAWTALSCRW